MRTKDPQRPFEHALKAYHAKMLAYHRDKVATLADEFQELAHQKTIGIRASYEALLGIVG